MALKWSDIDFYDRTIRLDPDVAGNKSAQEGSLPIPDALFERILQFYQITKGEHREICCTYPLIDAQIVNLHLFRGRRDYRPIARDTISRWFHRFSVAEKVVISAHRFRHTIATDMLRAGHDIRLVQQALQHKSLVSTMAYLHEDTAAMRDALINRDIGTEIPRLRLSQE